MTFIASRISCRILAGLSLLALAAGCATPAPLRVGLIATRDVAQGTFNSAAWQGLMRAQKDLGIEVANEIVPDTREDDAKAVASLIERGYNFIVTMSYDKSDVTRQLAVEYPDTRFVCVDTQYEDAPGNLRGILFVSYEPSFLAGYLAAAMSQSGVVGMFGAEEIPPITTFMQGFENGVFEFSQARGRQVQMLGSDVFIGTFDDQAKARDAAVSLMDQGADAIFSVTDSASMGALEAVHERDAMFIGVDSDWYTRAPEHGPVILTSAVKGIETAVYQCIVDANTGKWTSGTYEGKLTNGGVDIAPFHDFDGKIPDEVKRELDDLRMGKF